MSKINPIEQMNKSTFDGWNSEWVQIPRYQHIERLGHKEVDGILSGDVYIQNKIDGANLTVCYDTKVGHIICSRNGVKSVGEEVKNDFQGAVKYVLDHEGIKELSKRFILRGEWLVKHSVTYSKEAFNHFYVFDVQSYENLRYLTPEEYEILLRTYQIKYIPVLVKLSNPSAEDLIKYVDGPDEFGASQKEGIVIKNYNFVNTFGRIKWAKLISRDFKEKNALTFGTGTAHDMELKFAYELVNRASVEKLINKIKDEDGSIAIQSMPQILGMMWYELFSEELWGFVKRYKVRAFDFKEAQTLVTRKTRELALEYFNGLWEKE